MKRAVSSMGVLEGSSSAGDRRVVRLKRCSAFANLKRLGSTATTTATTTTSSANASQGSSSSSSSSSCSSTNSDASMFGGEELEWSSLGRKGSIGGHSQRRRTPTALATTGSQNIEKSSPRAHGDGDDECGPLLFGLAPPPRPPSSSESATTGTEGVGGGYHHQQVAGPAAAATATERRLMFSSSSSPRLISRISGGGCSTSSGGGGRIGGRRGFSPHHRKSFSAGMDTPSTVPAQQRHHHHQGATTPTTTDMLSAARSAGTSSSSISRCPFLQLEHQQRQQQQQQQQRGAVGFPRWMEGGESSPGFSIVGFDDCGEQEEDAAVGTSEEEGEEEEIVGGYSSSTFEAEAVVASPTSPNASIARHQEKITSRSRSRSRSRKEVILRRCSCFACNAGSRRCSSSPTSLLELFCALGRHDSERSRGYENWKKRGSCFEAGYERLLSLIYLSH
ncbi:unnamed protein product [Pylaiella littoralis]